MTTHTTPDGYCEDCGQPVIDGITGDVDSEGIAVCAACQDEQMAATLAEVHADLDAVYAQRAYHERLMAADHNPAPGSF